ACHKPPRDGFLWQDTAQMELGHTPGGPMNRIKVAGLAAALLFAACSKSGFEPNYTPTPVFSNPTNITNSYLPYASLQRDVLLGTEGGKAERVVRTRT